MTTPPQRPIGALRERLYHIVFESDTPAGRAFDAALIVAILLSVIVVLLDSLPAAVARWGTTLRVLEWAFTILFTAEYLLRLWLTSHTWQYARSFFGIIDLLAVLPSYLALLFPPGRFLLVIRILRVVRVFRILKLSHYVGESQQLARALVAARRKIAVFLSAVLSLVVIIGAVMYLVEGPENGFTSIPESIYWAVVTLSTVGYGDIAPQTPLGRVIASMVMIIGYGIIAVPTGIVTVELAQAGAAGRHRACPHCGTMGHDLDALFCDRCGRRLDAERGAGAADAPGAAS